MISTKWEEIDKRYKRSKKALDYMSQNPLTHEEAKEQVKRLRRMRDER